MDWSIDTDDQRRLDAKKRADAAHTTGGGQPDWAKIKRLADEDTCGDCSEECHICIAILAAREMLKVAAPQAAVPESPKCRGNNPFCPCQDGDLCHYEGENPMAVPESQDGLEHKVQAAREMIHNLCSPRFAAEHREWEMSIPARPDYDPDLVIADAIRVLEAQLIATRAELRDLKLAASLACELHGCASAGCTMAQYHQDVQKLLADLAAKDAELREAKEQRGRITSEDIDFIKNLCFQGPDMTERQERRAKRIIDEMRLLAAQAKIANLTKGA